jgi:hypothetical protein
MKPKTKTAPSDIKARKSTPAKAATRVHKDRKKEAKKRGIL